MTRREITRTWLRLQAEAERLVFAAIAESCRKNRTQCITNGPFGTMFARVRDRPGDGYSRLDGRWYKQLETPRKLAALIDWYTEKFGQLPQAINEQGKWV